MKKADVSYLIIDVRNNLGGRKDYPWGILPYLAKNANQGLVYASTSWTNRRTAYNFPSLNKRFGFKGKLYLLTNHRTFSNGSVITVYAKEFGEATVIGQETATRYEGFAAGSIQIVKLPNTSIKVGIPRYVWKFDLPTRKMTLKNRGVQPDIPITYTIDDYLNKEDKEMDKVMELIEKDQQTNH